MNPYNKLWRLNKMFYLEFTRLNGRDIRPKLSRIPADTTPAEEVQAFMNVMKMISAKVKEITAGVEWVVDLTELKQVYKVRLVETNDDEDTKEFLVASVQIYPVGSVLGEAS